MTIRYNSKVTMLRRGLAPMVGRVTSRTTDSETIRRTTEAGAPVVYVVGNAPGWYFRDELTLEKRMLKVKTADEIAAFLREYCDGLALDDARDSWRCAYMLAEWLAGRPIPDDAPCEYCPYYVGDEERLCLGCQEAAENDLEDIRD